MKWSFILFLPALVSATWALGTLALKRNITRAQVVLSLTLLLIAFAIVVLGVFFRGFVGRLFIYDFIFETVAMLCGPFLYIGICALTEPRGTTLRQRHSFILPLLFIAGLVAGSFWLGPRRYDQMCYEIREGLDAWPPGDTPWNFMYFWDHYLFPILLVLMDFILLLMVTRKVRHYQRRFNSYYAHGLNVPFIDSRQIVLLTWFFVPLAVATVLFIDIRPYYYKYWLIGCSLLLSVLLFYVGRFIYKLDYDARSLAEYVRNKYQIDSDSNS